MVSIIPVAPNAHFAATTPDGKRLYIYHRIDSSPNDTVTVIDTVTGTTVTILGPVSPPFTTSVAVHPQGTRLYAPGPGKMYVFDTATNALVTTIDGVAPHGPSGMLFTRDGSRLYIGDFNAHVIQIIDTVANTIVGSFPSGGVSPHGMVFSPLEDRLYVAHNDEVVVIDVASKIVLASISVPGAFNLTMKPDGSILYANSQISNSVRVIDTALNVEVASIPVGVGPQALAITPNGAVLYVSVDGSAIAVVRTDDNAVVGKIAVGEGVGDIFGIALGVSHLCLVAVDIKPGSFPNSINLGSSGKIPGAILSTLAFDAAAKVNRDKLFLAGAKVSVAGRSDKLLCHSEDVNADGLADLVCQFENSLQAQQGDSIAVLEGETLEGVPIRGEDSIRIVPD
jgi:YVTN family beta-propeller protein